MTRNERAAEKMDGWMDESARCETGAMAWPAMFVEVQSD